MNIKGIRQRGENSYQFRVSVNKGGGRYERRTKTYKVEQKLSPKKLEEHLRHEYLKFKNEVLSGSYVAPERMTFTDLMERWRQDVEPGLSPSTRVLYDNIIRKRLLPEFGPVRMDQFNVFMLDDFLANLKRLDGLDKPLSGTVKQSVYTVLRNVFTYAKKKGIVTDNLMDNVNKPIYNRNMRETVSAYTPEEVAQLFTAMDSIPWPWPMYFTLILAGGLRRGEALALEWPDIKLDIPKLDHNGVPLLNANSKPIHVGRLDIHKSIVNAKGKPAVKRTKTKTSERVVSLPESVTEQLKTFKSEWNQRKLAMGDRWTEQERKWLFCHMDGTYFTPGAANKQWQDLTRAAGIRHIRLHDLRHTAASVMIMQGIHAKTISERLGHSSIKITMDIYGHVMQETDQGAADSMDFLFRSNKKES